MAYVQIQYKTKQKVDLKPIANKLKPFFHLVDKSAYPFKVTVVDKKGFYDRSAFDLESNHLELKVDMTKQSQEEIDWVFAHEFAHFLSNNNPELKKTCLHNEHWILEKLLQKVYPNAPVYEAFHDFLPAEVFANGFATMVVGKFYKRHPINNAVRIINGTYKSARKAGSANRKG